MSSFDELVKLIQKLIAPDGCPWDHKQTLYTLRTYVLEEAYELYDAIEEGDPEHMKEEAGDLFHTLVFLSLIAEKEKKFTVEDALKNVVDKMIRRHPHIFGDTKVASTEEISHNWQKIKEMEKKGKPQKKESESLPSILLAQKLFSKIKAETKDLMDEDKWADEMIKLLKNGASSNIDMERILKNKLKKIKDGLSR